MPFINDYPWRNLYLDHNDKADQVLEAVSSNSGDQHKYTFSNIF